MSKVTKSQQTGWTAIVSKNYADQAIWFLNGFWGDLAGEAENVWHFWELFCRLDQGAKAEGRELDEFWSHKFLESLGEVSRGGKKKHTDSNDKKKKKLPHTFTDIDSD